MPMKPAQTPDRTEVVASFVQEATDAIYRGEEIERVVVAGVKGDPDVRLIPLPRLDDDDAEQRRWATLSQCFRAWGVCWYFIIGEGVMAVVSVSEVKREGIKDAADYPDAQEVLMLTEVTHDGLRMGCCAISRDPLTVAPFKWHSSPSSKGATGDPYAYMLPPPDSEPLSPHLQADFYAMLEDEYGGRLVEQEPISKTRH